MIRRLGWIVTPAILLFAVCTQGQKKARLMYVSAQSSSAGGAPEANATDVSSSDAILAALYDVISGPSSKPRDWNRFRSLFLPGARLIPTVAGPNSGERVRILSPDDYAAAAEPYFEKNGFFEKEVARKSERFGGVMQVFSTYESRHAATDAQPFARGVNSIQLFFDGKRWWVVTVFWQEETSANPLPKELLPQTH